MNQVGIDVSNEVFDATMQHDSDVVRKQFANTKTGHPESLNLRSQSGVDAFQEFTLAFHVPVQMNKAFDIIACARNIRLLKPSSTYQGSAARNSTLPGSSVSGSPAS